jgi:hypothetical protein
MNELMNIEHLFQQQHPYLGQLLNSNDFNKLVAIKDELNDTWHKKQIFRTETEMRVSVLNDASFPTPAAKYWQCVREQNVFFENIITLSFEYRKNLVEIKKLERQLAQETDPLEQELLNILLEEKVFYKATMELTAKDRIREIELWSKLKSELDDGSFNTRDVNLHQMQSLELALQNRASMITDHNHPDDVVNILGPLSTIQKINQTKT